MSTGTIQVVVTLVVIWIQFVISSAVLYKSINLTIRIIKFCIPHEDNEQCPVKNANYVGQALYLAYTLADFIIPLCLIYSIHKRRLTPIKFWWGAAILNGILFIVLLFLVTSKIWICVVIIVVKLMVIMGTRLVIEQLTSQGSIEYIDDPPLPSCPSPNEPTRFY